MSALAPPHSTQGVKRALRIESYLALARRSAALALAFDLPHVRHKHELAARTWLQLAELEAAPSPLAPAPGGARRSAQSLKRP